MTGDEWALGVLTFVCLVLFACAIRAIAYRDEMLKLSDQVARLEAERARAQALNPHAHLLGKVVEARVYEASEWERMVVVAVSWHGAVAVRPERDPQTTARWIRKELAPHRVREVRR